MERHDFGEERLIVPNEFTSPRDFNEDLVPPSHFASTGQPAGGHKAPGAPPPPISWINPVPTGEPCLANPWLAISQTQQQILELKRENQRIRMLHGDIIKEKTSAEHMSDLKTRSAERNERSRWESEWRLEAEKYKAEAERLRGQVEALKETVVSYREEMRDKDMTLSRNSHELEVMHEGLSKAKAELSQVREELRVCSTQKQKMSFQLEKLKDDSDKEITKLRRDVESGQEESQELALKVERRRLEAEEKAKQQVLKLLEQLEEMKKKQAVQLQQLNASHCAELGEARKVNSELQDRLKLVASEVLQLKTALMEVSTERDELKEHLSQMGQAFETQSATLHSLRNYIGQFAPENGEKERLNETIERLNKEKEALQTTAELLTVRLNSVNEILKLQEEKMAKKQNTTDPLLRNGSEVLHVLQLWREKVFKLCVQLRSKDIEIRREKDKLLSEVSSTEQQLQQEQHRSSVLQHSLHDRIAELDLERVEKETLKQNLVKVQEENAALTSLKQKTDTDTKTLMSSLQRFCQEFENKMTEMDAAKAKLNSFAQRLCFATRRVETIQGLVMRSTALQKIQQACKQTEEEDESIRKLRLEHSLVCEERDKLTQELKRTPELIKKALAGLKEQYENKVRQQLQELEHSCTELELAVAGKEEAERRERQIQTQLEESSAGLERLRCELLRQQEQSERALQERVSEMEEQCAEKLREMEVQVLSARREHTKAVMTLRQFQREAARKQDEMRESLHLQSESTKQDVYKKQGNFLSVTASETGLMGEDPQTHAATSQNSTSVKNQQNPSDTKCWIQTQVSPPAGERLLGVLEELRTLSAAVMNSSEESAEEDEQNELVKPSADSHHS